MSQQLAEKLSAQFANTGVRETLQALVELYPGQVAFSNSFGQEDQAIVHIIFDNELPVRVFTLDTGRLFQETYDVYQRTLERYARPIEVFFPSSQQVEALLQAKGPNSFYLSVENRKECCEIRKIEPLKRALQGVAVWVTGLRSGQSLARTDLPLFQWDAAFGLLKYNPLTKWNLEQLDGFLTAHAVPQNHLHKRGYISIGCAPCTVPVPPGTEDIRAGRWPWEQSHKECGLHKH